MPSSSSTVPRVDYSLGPNFENSLQRRIEGAKNKRKLLRIKRRILFPWNTKRGGWDRIMMKLAVSPPILMRSLRKAFFCSAASKWEGGVSMVQGASRGIGLEFVRKTHSCSIFYKIQGLFCFLMVLNVLLFHALNFILTLHVIAYSSCT